MLETVDLSKTISAEEYRATLTPLQVRLGRLGFQVYKQQRPVILAFEGWDAAGKGGAIKRVTERLDPRGYVTYPISAPRGDDAEHHYLWRFWRRLPEAGQIAIFDRTWYGRVLVERIEGFATENEWRRAYREINHFEQQLVEFGTILVKFWLHISQEEQLQRFEMREHTAYKAWKLTDEDWRNREKWDDYNESVSDMLVKTSTTLAPWTVVPANDKRYARVFVLETIVGALENALDLPDDYMADMKVGKSGKKKKRKGNKGKGKAEAKTEEKPDK